MASTSNSPPPPNTNRRVFHDVSVIANIPPDDPKLKSFRIALIAAETWKRKDLMSGGAVIGPEGIEVFARGKKALELDEIDPGVVKKEMKVWVEKNLDEEKKKAVEEAGILKPAMASGKKAVLVVGKGNEGIAKSRGKSSASNEPSMKKKDKKSSDNAKNDVENDVENHGEKQQLHKEEESIEINWDEDITYTWNCDEIRRKIKTFVENSGMEAATFQRAINAPPGTFVRFMKLRGAQSGAKYKAFEGATRFFQAREAAGLPMPAPIEKPATKTAEVASAGDDVEPGSAAGHPLEIMDSDIAESDDDIIPVFDSCDEIRRKISAHLRQPGVTQAQFLRDIAAPFGQDVKIQSKQLSDFRSKTGALAGNTSRVFYGAYVFFEILRLKEGKPKGKHRLEMEERWGPDGVDIWTASGRVKYIVGAGRELVMNEYGQVRSY